MRVRELLSVQGDTTEADMGPTGRGFDVVLEQRPEGLDLLSRLRRGIGNWDVVGHVEGATRLPRQEANRCAARFYGDIMAAGGQGIHRARVRQTPSSLGDIIP